MRDGGAAGALVMFMMIFYVVIFAVAIGALILWVWMLIDVATRPAWQFPDARPDSQIKLLWILLVALAGWIGAIIYYFMIYKKMGKSNTSLPPPPYWYQQIAAYPPPPGTYPPAAYPPPPGTYPPAAYPPAEQERTSSQVEQHPSDPGEAEH